MRPSRSCCLQRAVTLNKALIQDDNGCTPLHFAVLAKHASVVKQLLAVRCNVDLQMKKGHTALYCAASGRAILRYTALQVAGHTALQVAELCGYNEIATLIRNKRVDTPLLGRRVIINGLVAKPELNGRTGTAVRFDEDKGRYYSTQVS
jgi:ankyrin repeat protein